MPAAAPRFSRTCAPLRVRADADTGGLLAADDQLQRVFRFAGRM